MSESWRTTHDLPLPRPEERGFALFAISSLLLSCLFAVANLTIFEKAGGISKIASLLWIGMTLFVVTAGIQEAGGFANWVNGQISLFAKRHWVRIVRKVSEPATIAIGFSIGRQDFEWFRIEVSKLTKIQWSSGQASAMLGHDANDWHVAMWYRTNAHAERSGDSDEESHDLVLIGPQRSKAETAELGERFARFLADAEIPMFRVSETEYVRVANEEPSADQNHAQIGVETGRTSEMKPGSS